MSNHNRYGRYRISEEEVAHNNQLDETNGELNRVVRAALERKIAETTERQEALPDRHGYVLGSLRAVIVDAIGKETSIVLPRHRGRFHEYHDM